MSILMFHVLREATVLQEPRITATMTTMIIFRRCSTCDERPSINKMPRLRTTLGLLPCSKVWREISGMAKPWAWASWYPRLHHKVDGHRCGIARRRDVLADYLLCGSCYIYALSAINLNNSQFCSWLWWQGVKWLRTKAVLGNWLSQGISWNRWNVLGC